MGSRGARLGSALGMVTLAAALLAGSGCGDNSNKTINLDGATPTPVGGATSTATPAVPVPTATPGAGTTTRVVTINGDSSAALQGFTIRVEYPTAKGSFAGSADGVECTSAVSNFVANDLDDGNLLLVAASTSGLTFPFDVTCNFDQVDGQNLAAGDLNLVVQSVTEGGVSGDPADLTVSATVS